MDKTSKIITTMNNLRAFVQVARSGGFTAAAETMGLSASALSKSVLRLEAELGVKLLHRTTRQLSLTSEGQVFFERASVILDSLRELEEQMSQGQSRLRGNLRLNFPAALGRNVMIEPVTAFLQKHPELRCEFTFDDRLIDLAQEAMDVTVRTGRLPDSTSLIVTQFFQYQAVICAAPSFLAGLHLKDRDDLNRHSCLGFQVRSSGRPSHWRLRRGSFEPQPRYVFEDLSAMCRAAVAGAGICLLPTWSCLEELKQGKLLEILPRERPTVTPVWLTYHDRRYVPPKITAFVAEMKTFGQNLGDTYLRP